MVPEWFNGFTLFGTYPPGWVFFTYPLLKILGNIMLATFISMILLFILGFIGINILGKELKMSPIKRIAFFLFVYANPMIIGAVLKQGRLPALMGLVLFTYIVYIGLYFKEREVNKKIILLGILFGLIIITHQAETILSGIFILGLILIKSNKERILALLLEY